MKLPSLSHISAQAAGTVRRFPLPLLSALAGTVAAMIMVQHDADFRAEWLMKVLLAALLGIPLFTGIVMLGIRKGWNPGRLLAVELLGAALLVAYALSLPDGFRDAPRLHAVRFVFFLVAVHLFAAFSPFLGRNSVNGFWHYNTTLAFRFLAGALYSGILFGGLALALAAIDHLFGADIGEKWYFDLWIVIAGMLNTWFFLAGVPDDPGALDALEDYPPGLKFFAQFVLLPIVGVYAAILYVYMGKILAAWDWPQGWVSRLVLGFSITGILSLLLVHPINRRPDGNVWIRRISRWYYVALLPLAALMLLAIWRRVTDYGIVEARYAGLVVGLWLIGISVYFVASREKNITLIPVSLCLVALLSAFGPWGAFRVSERSQVQRLGQILEKNAMLNAGKVRQPAQAVPFEDARRISSIVRYLCTVHGATPLQSFFEASLDSLAGQFPPATIVAKDSPAAQAAARRDRYWQLPARIVAAMGVRYIDQWQTSALQDSRTFYGRKPAVVALEGYSALIHHTENAPPGPRGIAPPAVYTTAEGIVEVSCRESLFVITLSPRDGDGTRDSVCLNLSALSERLSRDYPDPAAPIPGEKMVLGGSGSSGMRAEAYFSNFTSGLRDQHGAPRWTGFEAEIYLGRK